ncbi:MAG: class I SAM-dependent methyltransferase [Anaerolineae bacterium]|nr:class I SAM-dependent methyltransferase [Anaerolineae bacterium]
MPETPPVPAQHYTDDYFDKWNYADRPLGRYSMYWFARRYFAALIRRYAPPGGPERVLLEMGCGLGDLLMLLQDDFSCIGVDLIPRSIESTQRLAPKARARVGDATDFTPYADGALSVVVALHLLEHLPQPQATIGDIYRALKPGGLFFFATPHPEYSLRRFKDRATDAIGKDQTHINCHPPATWRGWCEGAGLVVLKQFGDGLWDVPYVPLVPARVQFALFGLPALAQVLTRTTFTPPALGVNQINVVRKAGKNV